MSTNGIAATAVSDVDLAGVLEIALTEARADLASRADRCDALRQLRDRAVVLAVDSDEVVTSKSLWDAVTDEADRAALEALFSRVLVDLPELFAELLKHEEESWN